MKSEWMPLGIISEKETENMKVQASHQQPLELQELWNPEEGGQSPPDSRITMVVAGGEPRVEGESGKD